MISLNPSNTSPAVQLYPEPAEVLDNPALSCYFLPLMSFTHEHLENQQAYTIHLFGTEGLSCISPRPYAEDVIHGFDYNEGRYRYLADPAAFGDYHNVSEVYGWLLEDFNRNSEYYLHEHISAADYGANVQVALNSIATFDSRRYAEAIYSYLYTKTHYQRTGELRRITELTDNQAPSADPLLLDRLTAQEFGQPLVAELSRYTQHDYHLRPEMIVGGTERSRFLSPAGQGSILAALDTEKQQVYLLNPSAM
ncbi:hypothetical protein [Paenibacillus bovis]|uniref:Uncharacterized protein n=1 Tax=Paenibacillus bovis TaxID=1616788 RepID=A0A172ZDS1_9BACL|nr:hypothetical protein [Paenibacillus bovis]ANF95758.1 hypothetical protein AR543_06905 [Paenibacillus bovis]